MPCLYSIILRKSRQPIECLQRSGALSSRQFEILHPFLDGNGLGWEFFAITNLAMEIFAETDYIIRYQYSDLTMPGFMVNIRHYQGNVFFVFFHNIYWYGLPLLLMTACGPKAADPAAQTQNDAVASSKASPPTDDSVVPKQSTPQPRVTAYQDEIVPLLNPIPAPITDAKTLSEDPTAIRKEVHRLLADEKPSEALPLIDVLLILNPADFEMLETRGRILLQSGFNEDGGHDLNRCCESGRKSCCR